MPVSFSSRILVPDHVLKRELDGEAVILNLDSERYFGLDEIGTRMLVLLSTCETIQQAYGALIEEYDVAPEVLRNDLQALLDKLLENGLVQIDAAESAQVP